MPNDIEEKILKPKTIRVKEWVTKHICPECETELERTFSDSVRFVFYKCKCGLWQYNWTTDDFKIVTDEFIKSSQEGEQK